VTQLHRHRDFGGHRAQEVVQPFVVALLRRMQLHQQGRLPIAEFGPAGRHPLDPLLGGTQPAGVGQTS
jgi:hypothetical protein